MLLWIPLLLQIAQAQPQTPATDPNAKPPARCTVSGKAVDAITGEPLRKVSIVLNGRDRDTSSGMSASTDAGGAFTIREIFPGKYGMMAQRAGYINQQYGARHTNMGAPPITLQPGQEMKDVVFRLWPHGVITGRIVDSDGDPIPYASLTLQKMTWTSGQKRLQTTGGSSTNDLGEYRIFGVAAGRYYLQATVRNMRLPNGAFEAEDFAPAWYPGVRDSHSAVVLDVQPGQTLRGVDMTIQKIPTRHVRGKIVNLVPGKTDFMQLMLTSRDSDGFANFSSRVPAAKPEFDLRVPPGSWNLIAYRQGGAPGGARMAVDVGDSDLDNVVITIQPAGEISGHLRIDGSTDLTALANSTVRVTLNVQEMMPRIAAGNQSAAVDGDGAFTLKNVSAEPMNVYVSGLPAGYYTKSIQFGRQDVKADSLTYVGSADSLDIVVSPNSAAVQGIVKKKSGEPVTGAAVVLIPPPALRTSSRNYRISMTDEKGQYSLTPIEPGKYTLFAWEDIEPGIYYDPDFMRQMENRGKAFDLKESAHEAADLDVIPAEETPQAGGH